MAKTTGRAVLFKIAIAKPDADPTGLTFLLVGALRDKSIKFDWDAVDATADDSADFTKEELVTFKTVSISGGGVAKFDTASNQELLEAQVTTPGVATDYQPHAWVELTYPNGKKYRGPFLFKSWSVDSPYADVITFSTEATSAGPVTRIPAP